MLYVNENNFEMFSHSDKNTHIATKLATHNDATAKQNDACTDQLKTEFSLTIETDPVRMQLFHRMLERFCLELKTACGVKSAEDSPNKKFEMNLNINPLN